VDGGQAHAFVDHKPDLGKVVLLAASFILLIVTFTQVEGGLPTQPSEV